VVGAGAGVASWVIGAGVASYDTGVDAGSAS